MVRAITYYTVALWRAEGTLRPGRVAPFGEPSIPDDVSLPRIDTPVQARTWIDNELTNLVAGLEQATAISTIDERLMLWMAYALSSILHIRDERQTAHRISLAVTTSLRSRGDDDAIASALLLHGVSEGLVRNFEEAVAHLDRAITVMRRMGNDIGIARALNGLGVAHARRGDPAASLPAHEEAFELARRRGFRHLEASALMGMSIACLHLGNFQDAATAAAHGVDIFLDQGDHWGATSCTTCLLAAYSLGGNQAEAVRCADEALALARQAGYALQECMTLLLRADANVRWGRPSDAYSDLEQALPLARTSGYHYAWPVAQWLLFKVLKAMGRTAEAALARERAEDAHARWVGARRDMHMERLFEWHAQPVPAQRTDRA